MREMTSGHIEHRATMCRRYTWGVFLFGLCRMETICRQSSATNGSSKDADLSGGPPIGVHLERKKNATLFWPRFGKNTLLDMIPKPKKYPKNGQRDPDHTPLYIPYFAVVKLKPTYEAKRTSNT